MRRIEPLQAVKTARFPLPDPTKEAALLALTTMQPFQYSSQNMPAMTSDNSASEITLSIVHTPFLIYYGGRLSAAPICYALG